MTYIASTFSTTTSSNPVGVSIGQKSFYAKGYFFVFYANGAYIKYRSSSNGTSWGSEQAVSAMSTSASNGFAVVYDGGDYCYYARCPKDTTTLYYRRGTIGTDGTITWGSEVDTSLGYANSTRVCNIDIDTSGYVLIAYYKNNYPWVARNGVANSASWSSATTWQLNNSEASVNYYVQVCPLSNRKWLALYTGTTNGLLYSRYYDGSTLNNQVTVTATNYNPSGTMRWTAVSDRANDIVYFAENGGPSPYYIYFWKWTTAGWGSREAPRSTNQVAYTATPYLVYNATENAVYCFWYTSSVIYHRKRSSAGTWDSSDTTDYSDSNNGAMDYSNYALYPQNGYAVLTYPTGTGSPYNLKFFALQVVTIQNKSITDEAFTTSDVSYRNKPSLSIADTLGVTIESMSRPLRTMPLGDSVGLDDEMSRPSRKMPLSDVLGLSDIGYRSRTGGLSVSDALALAEALSRPKKTIPFADTLGINDVLYRNRTAGLLFSDSLTSVDSLKRNKTAGLKVSDTLGATTESVTRPKRTMPLADSVSETDISYRNKTGGLKVSDSLGYSDSFLANKTMKLSDSTHAVDSAGPRNKTIPILEALSTGDSALVGKTLKFLDTLALSSESLKKTRKLAPMNDTLSASEIVKANKSFTFTDAFNLFEALYRNRNTKVTDALTLSDILLRAGTVKLADALGLADSVITGKSLTMRDTLAIADLTLANKRFNPIAESFRVVDSFKRNKRLTLAESLQTIDSLVNDKPLTLIEDDVTQTQAISRDRTAGLAIPDSVTAIDRKSLVLNENGLQLSSPVLDLQDSFTICGWIKRFHNPLKIGQNYLTLGSSAGSKVKLQIYNNWADSYANGQINIFYRDTVNYSGGYYRSFTAQPGRDYFIATAWDKEAGKLYFYLDGNVLGGPLDFPYTYMRTSDKINFGQSSPNYGDRGACAMHDVMIFSGVKTQAEIQALMANNPDGSESDLIAYWPMDEGEGDTIHDLGPNNITGTLSAQFLSQGPVLDKDLLVYDGLDADDLALINKTLKLSDAYHYNDVSLVGKSLRFADTFGATDVASRVKRSFGLTDSLSANETVTRTLRQMKIADALALADALKLNKTLKIAESLGITDNATIVLKGNLVLIADSFTASELVQRTKRTIPILENVSASEALLVAKKLILSDPFHYTDVMLLKSRSLKFSDAVSITDTLVRGKRLPLADSITSTDSFKTNKTLKGTDVLSSSDVARRNKTGGLKVNDVFSSTEALKTNKNLKTYDGLSAVEALRRNKNFPIADTLSLTDINRANKGLIVNDELDVLDNYHSPCVSFDGLLNGSHIDRYIQTANPVNNISTNFTIEFYLYLNRGHRLNGGTLTTDDHVGLFNSFGGTTGYIWCIKGYDTYPNDIFRTTLNLTGSTVDRQTPLPYSIKNGWHHIAISYDGSLAADNLVYYVDGDDFAKFTCPGYLRNGTSKMRLGNITTYWLEGKMSGVKVWDVTKSADDIKNNMDARLTGTEADLVFYMPLNEGSGTTAHELVANNDGTLTNISWATPSLERDKSGMKVKDYVSQMDTHGVTFNGINGYCTFDNAVLDIQDSFTCNIRFRVNKMGVNTQFILAGGASDNPSGGKFRIAASPSTMSYGFGIQQPGTWNWNGPSKTLEIGRDYFATLQWDKPNQKFRVYIDGVQLGSDVSWTYSNLNSSTKLAIGALGQSYYWSATTISDLSIWNGVRSQAQIQDEMLNPPDGTEDNLIAYWPFSEGTGTTVTDIGPNHIAGTLVGSTWTQGGLVNKDLTLYDVLDSDDLVYANKRFTIQDAQHVVETLFKNAKLTVQDSAHLAEVIRTNKRLKLNDSLNLTDSLLVMKHILLYDVAHLTEKLTTNKKLTVQEAFALNDVLNTQRHLQILDSFTADDEISQSKLFIHYHRLQAQIATISRVLGVDTISNQMEAESKQKTLDGKDSQPDSLEGSDPANDFSGTP